LLNTVIVDVEIAERRIGDVQHLLCHWCYCSGALYSRLFGLAIKTFHEHGVTWSEDKADGSK
jgi:hypothetical protein